MEKYIKVNLSKLQQLSKILNKPITFIDLETTGMVHENHFAIIEIGIVHIYPTSIEEKNSLVDPQMKIPSHISEITNIYDYMVKGKPTFQHFSKYIAKIAQEHIFCGYNSKTFDSKGLEKMLRQHNLNYTFGNQIDFRHVFLRGRRAFDGIPGQSGSLVQACTHHDIFVDGSAHRAGYDIAITAMLGEKLLEKYGFGLIHKEVEKFSDANTKKLFYEHMIKNKIAPII